nr:hypothetical protein K-LCC10_0186 [Kaumoebavirus]
MDYDRITHKLDEAFPHLSFDFQADHFLIRSGNVLVYRCPPPQYLGDNYLCQLIERFENLPELMPYHNNVLLRQLLERKSCLIL